MCDKYSHIRIEMQDIAVLFLVWYDNEKSDIDDPMPLYIEMANLYICTGEYKRSLAVLKNVHEKDKNNVEVYECMAISFENLGEIAFKLNSIPLFWMIFPRTPKTIPTTEIGITRRAK